jgi:uncharacterized protein (TIGR02231 family)
MLKISMKKIVLLAPAALLLLLGGPARGAEGAVVVESAIRNVTVFLRGAEVQREAEAAIKSGPQQIVFDHLPQNINPQSIQVAGSGNFTILGVSHRVNHLRPLKESEAFERLVKLVKSVREKLEARQAALANVEEETEMLKANAAIGGADTGVKTADLKEFADFYRARLGELSARRLELKSEIRDIEEEKKAVEHEWNLAQSQPRRPTSSIVVEITAPAAAKVKLTASYLVNDASWTPSYDLRVADTAGPVELTYVANVRQSTGEEWRNVKPVFSTANPTVNNTRPELNPWYLSLHAPAPPSQYQSFNVMPRAAKAARAQADMAAEMPMPSAAPAPAPAAASAAESTAVVESQTSVEFAIDIPYTIPGDGQSRAVEIAKHKLPASYEYYAVRKLEKDVFLLAKVSGWENLNLLPGPASTFFEGRYVGASQIDTRRTEDKLTLSLGRDKNITVTRIRKKDYSEKQFFGGNTVETREWDLTVHNKKKQPVTIAVEDQIPLSTDEKIKVEALNISDATLDAETGKLIWNLTLNPAETRKMNVKYSVKYPKDSNVILE